MASKSSVARNGRTSEAHKFSHGYRCSPMHWRLWKRSASYREDLKSIEQTPSRQAHHRQKMRSFWHWQLGIPTTVEQDGAGIRLHQIPLWKLSTSKSADQFVCNRPALYNRQVDCWVWDIPWRVSDWISLVWKPWQWSHWWTYRSNPISIAFLSFITFQFKWMWFSSIITMHVYTQSLFRLLERTIRPRYNQGILGECLLKAGTWKTSNCHQ